ncbi:hypothetical protein D920_00521, partial [Enterococcus faecalis 13-SD-W-01]
ETASHVLRFFELIPKELVLEHRLQKSIQCQNKNSAKRVSVLRNFCFYLMKWLPRIAIQQ